MGIIIKAPDGSNSVTIQQSTNVSKTVEASDIASDSYFKARTGTSGNVNFRNKLVDGRFDFWYEGTSQTTSGYGSATMWVSANTVSTKVFSRQPLVAGVDLPAIDCPTAKYFSRTVVTSVAGAINSVVEVHNMEGVGLLAGKTVTVSFYAKADAVKNIALTMAQVFGTGGSPSSLVNGIGAQLVSLSTTWKRYTAQITLPSISGKTLGTSGDFLQLCFWFDAGSSTFGSILGQQSGTFDIACVQLEEGSVATPFEELPPEIALSRVNRYYQFIPMNTYKPMLCSSTTTGYMMVDFLSPMRDTPSLVLATSTVWINGTVSAVTASSTNSASISSALINITVESGLTNLALAMVSGAGLKADARL